MLKWDHFKGKHSFSRMVYNIQRVPIDFFYRGRNLIKKK